MVSVALLFAGLAAAETSPLPGLPAPPAPPAATATVALPEELQPKDDVLVPPSLWDGLQPPDGRVLDVLAARIPGLDKSKVRQATPELAVGLMSQAASRGLSALDVFTDAGLMNDRIYYIPQSVMSQMDAAFDLGSLFLVQGTTVRGSPFVMQALVMGGGKVEMLYNLLEFTFVHPVFRDYGGRYTFKSRISQTIEAPGTVRIEGVVGPLDAVIRKFIKLSPTKVRVVTSMLDQESPLYPIKKR